MFNTTGKPTVQKLLKKEDFKPPEIHINYEVLEKMNQYIQQSDTEIAWLGLVDKTNNVYTIYEVSMMKQKISSVTAEIHESGLQEFANRLIKEKRTDELSAVRCWGHSHVEMEVNPSSQDEETFDEYARECDFFIRMIGNKKGKLKIDLTDRKRELRFDNLTFTILYPEKVWKHIEEYNKASEEIEKWKKTVTTEVEKVAKEEISKYTEREYIYKWKYKNQTVEDEYSIKTKYTEKYTGKTQLTSVLRQSEIEDIAEFFKMGEDIKTEYKNTPAFRFYNDEDWENLLDICKEYLWKTNVDSVYDDYEYGAYGGYGEYKGGVWC